MNPIQKTAAETVAAALGGRRGAGAACKVDARDVLLLAELVPADGRDGPTKDLVAGVEKAARGRTGPVTVYPSADALRHLLEQVGGGGDAPRTDVGVRGTPGKRG